MLTRNSVWTAEKTKQYVYVMAIVAGGSIIIGPHYGPEPVATFALYALWAFLFSFIWPSDGWRWGLIIAFPALVLSGLRAVNAGTPMVLLGEAHTIAGMLVFACGAGFYGGRWSFRRVEVANAYSWRDARSSTQQYIHVLAIVTGGIIVLAPRIGPEILSAFLIYSVLAALFGFIWPNDGWQWGIWISLPLVMLTGYKMALTMQHQPAHGRRQHAGASYRFGLGGRVQRRKALAAQSRE